ncbi:hypothetical protein [Ehrlichia japonica]|uniref:Uncharacterized protein n=1 Tax=Ehrlichia japonica TaxID=391036 RepID=X5GK58_9RICK|nr:hypothetical protein [Ehrlichia japonica]AHX04491.1 hypothetical protein EHF_0222 [Ehrlichia japonica]
MKELEYSKNYIYKLHQDLLKCKTWIFASKVTYVSGALLQKLSNKNRAQQ